MSKQIALVGTKGFAVAQGRVSDPTLGTWCSGASGNPGEQSNYANESPLPLAVGIERHDVVHYNRNFP
jgi:hypothetical protein